MRISLLYLLAVLTASILSKLNITLTEPKQLVMLNNTVQPAFSQFTQNSMSKCQPMSEYIEINTQNF